MVDACLPGDVLESMYFFFLHPHIEMHVGKKKKKKKGGWGGASVCHCTPPICCLLRFLPHWCAAKRHPPTITASPPLTFVNHCSACDSENTINNTCCKRGFVFYISNFHGNVEIAELLIKAKIKQRRNEKKHKRKNRSQRCCRSTSKEKDADAVNNGLFVQCVRKSNHTFFSEPSQKFYFKSKICINKKECFYCVCDYNPFSKIAFYRKMEHPIGYPQRLS